MKDLSSNRWRSRLWVLAACSGLAVTGLQPSIVVADDSDAQLVSAFGPDLEMARDRAAAGWLATTQFGADDTDASSAISEMVEQALADRTTPTTPAAPTTVPPPPSTTTTIADPVTTKIPPTTTSVPAISTTSIPPPSTTIPSSSTAQAEQRFVDLIDQERAAEGLSALEVDVDIRAVARNWTEEMIRNADGCSLGDLEHNPAYAEQMPKGWTRVAENVGCGRSVDSIHQAFMSSPGHRQQILDEGFTDVGVGVGIAADGTMWVTQNFGKY